MSFLRFLVSGSQSTHFEYLQERYLLSNVGSSNKEDSRTEQEIEASANEYHSEGSIFVENDSNTKEIKLISLDFTSSDTALKTWKQFRTYSTNIYKTFGLAGLALSGWTFWKVLSNRSLQKTHLMMLIGALACVAIANVARTRALETIFNFPLLPTKDAIERIVENIISFRQGALRTFPPALLQKDFFLNYNPFQFFTETELSYIFTKILETDFDEMNEWYGLLPDISIPLSTLQANLVYAFLLFRQTIDIEVMKSNEERLYGDFVATEMKPIIKDFLDSSKYTNDSDKELACLFNSCCLAEISKRYYSPSDEGYKLAFLEVCDKIKFKLNTDIKDAIEYIKSEAYKDFTFFLYLPCFKSQMENIVTKMQNDKNTSTAWLSKQFQTIKDQTMREALLECLNPSKKDDD